MAVPFGDREEAKMQFLDDAKKLHYEVISLCIKCPQRWEAHLTMPISKIAGQVLSYIKKGNSVYICDDASYDLRIKLFSNSILALQDLSSHLGNLYDYSVECEAQDPNNKGYRISSKKIAKISNLINNEIKLIKGVIKSDKNRYKNFKKNSENNKNKIKIY